MGAIDATVLLYWKKMSSVQVNYSEIITKVCCRAGRREISSLADK